MLSAPSRRRHFCAFTLVELLVVIAIIGSLVALLLPAIQAARESARRSQCQNRLKQVGLAVQMHHDQKGSYPTGRERIDQFGVSWAFRLLPFMEHQVNHDARDPTQRVDDPANADAMRTPVETFYCPSRREPAADRDFDNHDQPSVVRGVAAGGDYAGNAGWDLMFNVDNRLKEFDPSVVAGPIFTRSLIKDRYVTDGLSQTLAIGERHIPPLNETVEPGLQHHEAGDTAFFAGDSPTTVLGGVAGGLAQDPQDPDNRKFGSEHPSVAHFVYLDGHVNGVDKETDEETLKRLAAFGDGQVIDAAKTL